MPSNKHDSIMAKAIGLTSSMFSFTSCWNMPFHQLQQLQCYHHDYFKGWLVLLWAPFLSPLPRWWQFAVHMLWLRCKTRVSAELAGALLPLFSAWNVFEKLRAKWSIVKHCDQATLLLLKLINEAHTLTMERSVFSIVAGLIVEIDTFHAALCL